jgi:hypothetical protein
MSTTYTVPATGTYTFTLTVQDFNGNLGQATVTKSIGPLGEDVTAPTPVAGVTCPSLNCTMTGAGSTDDGGIKTYTWTVKNAAGTQIGSPIVGSTASFTAPSLGQYTFTLTVVDWFTRTAQTSVTRAVTPNGEDTQPPVAVPSVTCPNFTCNMSGNASSDDGGIQSYAWTITPGGATRPTSIASYTAPAQGYYTFTLTVTDYFGRVAQASVVKGVTANGVDNVPQAVITSENYGTNFGGRTLSGNSLSSTDDIAIASWSWKLCPDATPTSCLSGSTASWTVSPVDQYLPATLTVTVRDGANQVGTASRHFTNNDWPWIEPPPLLGAVITNNSYGSAATTRVLAVDGTASNYYMAVASYAWRLCPDATPASCQTASSATWTVNPVTPYLAATLTLTVTDGNGRTASSSQHFTTNDWP